MMTKTMATLAALALTSVFTATGASASATNAGPDPGTDPVIGAWTLSSFTDWQTDPNPPADPDGQDGEDNPLNTVRVGERYDKVVVDTEAWTETVVDAEAWTETVVDAEAWTETIPAVPGFWTNFEPNDKHGTFIGPPTWPTDPEGSWSEPKTNGGPDPEASGVYQNGHGYGSWFYRSQGTPERVIEHPAVTHTVDHPAVTHTVDHPAVTHTVDHPAVTHTVEHPAGSHIEYCWSIDTRTVTPGTPPVDNPPSVNPPTVSPAADVPPSVSTPRKAGTPAAPAVPVSIDAGL
jgi:hypothetical protein